MLGDELKKELCVLGQNKNIHYFDYAATTFMCKCSLDKYCEFENNIGIMWGKGNNRLSKDSKYIFDKSCNDIREHFGISDNYSMILGKNTTELINIFALSLEDRIKPLDIIMVGPYEHHSNYLPWKYIAKKKNAIFFEMPLLEDGSINYNYIKKIADKIKIIAYSSVANTNAYSINEKELLSVINKETYVFVDESQKVAHSKIICDDKIDAYILSSHKMYGPKNIAGAYVKNSVINDMKPIILGGGMISTQNLEDTWLEGKDKFLGGTYNIGLVLAWAEACKFIEKIGYEKIIENEKECFDFVVKILKECDGIDIMNRGTDIYSMISFVSEKYHAHDIESLLSKSGIIIRTGNLCSQNSIRKMGENAINRISFGIGITQEDIYILGRELKKIG